jgi:hypothetical protein
MLALDVDINSGGLKAGMPQELLDGEDVDPSFQQVGGETMAQRVDRGGL